MDSPFRDFLSNLRAVDPPTYHVVAWLDGEISRVETQRVLFSCDTGCETVLFAYCRWHNRVVATSQLVPVEGVAEIVVDPSPEGLAQVKERLVAMLATKGPPSRR